MEESVLEEAYGKFLEARRTLAWPAGYPIDYALATLVEGRDWGPFIDFQIEGDLRELINLLNTWRRHLHDWEIWMGTVDPNADNDAWTIRDHFIEPLVFYCIMKPSSTRDLLATVATHAIHHTNLQTISGYSDRLKQDEKPGILRRSEKEAQVSKIGKSWVGTLQFMRDLTAFDSKEYRTTTRDFRNLASHAIAPRFEFGYTNLVTRSIVAANALVLQEDGTSRVVYDSAKKHVVYCFGGTPPLDLREVLKATKDQYMLAAQAFNSYQTLLIELMEKLPESSSLNT